MIKVILKWLLGNPAAILGAVVTTAFVIMLIGKNHDIDFYKGQLTERDERLGRLQGANATLRNNVATLTDSVNTQNKAIADMAASAKARDIKFDEAFVALQGNRQHMDTTLAELRRRPAPADKCKGAYDLVKEMAK